ncbi:MAG TPA: VWA domain-containing protein [Geminicoccaceae bacterium]|nr:VWA domain-containing protein [Geminicoccaceae bacterium]
MAKTYDDFFDDLGFRESSNRYNIENPYGFLGRYQMGEAALVDAGYYVKDGTAANDWKGRWTSKNDISSKDNFLTDEDGQDAAVRDYASRNWRYIETYKLDIYEGQVLNGYSITVSGMLAAGHLVGVPGGLRAFIRSGGTDIRNDAFNTKATDYLTRFEGYATPFTVDHEGADHLNGGAGSDTLRGFGGADTLEGKGGIDELRGGAGRDVLYGGDDADRVYGDDDADIGFGNLHADIVSGGNGNDRLYGDDRTYLGVTTATRNAVVDGENVELSVTALRETTTESMDVSGVINIGGALAPYNVAFVVDVSGSMVSPFSGSVTIGDVNGDGYSNTRLDALIVAFESLVESLNRQGLGQQVNLAIIPFDSSASLRPVGAPAADADGNGVLDAVEAARALRSSGATYFDQGLSFAETFLSGKQGSNFIYFLSDGEHNGGDYTAVLNRLRDPAGIDARIDAIGIGSGASISRLSQLDSDGSATLALDPTQLEASLGVSAIDPSDVSKVELLVGGQVVETLLPGDLVDSAFGLRFEATVDGLDTTEGSRNEVLVRVTLSTGDTIELKRVVLGSEDGDDRVFGGEGADTLYGGGGNDRLDGGAGLDRYFGGSGNDTYVIDDPTERALIFERDGEGTDVLEYRGSITPLGRASASGPTALQLPGNVETLSIKAKGDFAISGTDADDRLISSIGNDQLNSLGGNDRVFGGKGNDLLAGAAGDDQLSGGQGVDTLIGGDGNDLLSGGLDLDRVYGGNGDDQYRGTAAELAGDLIDAFAPGDRIVVTNRSFTIADLAISPNGRALALDTDQDGVRETVIRLGTAVTGSVYTKSLGRATEIGVSLITDQTLVGDAGDNTLVGGAGNDHVSGLGGNDRLIGGLANDRLYGGDGDDFITGNDPAVAENGRDTLDGGNGNDRLDGGDGNDSLYGGAGDDTLDGNGDADLMYGGTGVDDLDGGAGNDVIQGDDGADRVVGDIGNDRLFGGIGNDVLRDEDGNDVHDGGAGDDTLTDLEGDDSLYGGTGNDSIYGGNGVDTVFGGDGNDRLSGGNGPDVFYGGAGNDVYVWELPVESPAVAGGIDVYLDFVRGEDRLDFRKLDGDTGKAGLQAVELVTRGGTLGKGQLTIEEQSGSSFVVANTDADSDIDFRIEIRGVTGMTASDLWLAS